VGRGGFKGRKAAGRVKKTELRKKNENPKKKWTADGCGEKKQKLLLGGEGNTIGRPEVKSSP